MPSLSVCSNKDHDESFLGVDVDGLYKILNHLHELLPGQLVVVVGVVDGVKLIKFLIIKRVGLVDLVQDLLGEFFELGRVEEARAVVVVGIEEVKG